MKMPDGSTLEDQFDIVMLNGSSAAIIEIKYKAEDSDVEDLVTRKLKNFKILYPQYKDFTFYLGLGSFSFDEYAVKKARELGVGILKQTGETMERETKWIRTY
jgi:hypothetical protein